VDLTPARSIRIIDIAHIEDLAKVSSYSYPVTASPQESIGNDTVENFSQANVSITRDENNPTSNQSVDSRDIAKVSRVNKQKEIESKYIAKASGTALNTNNEILSTLINALADKVFIVKGGHKVTFKW